MGNNAKAVSYVDPPFRDSARHEPAAATESYRTIDDVLIALQSELLAYAPPRRGQSAIPPAPAVPDDPEDRIPLFLEREEQEADDGFHHRQRDGERKDEIRSVADTAHPSSRPFEPDMRQASIDTFIRPTFPSFAMRAGLVALAVSVIGGLLAFFGAFTSAAPPAERTKQVAQLAPPPKQTVNTPVQAAIAVADSIQPAKKQDISDVSASSRAALTGKLASATNDPQLQTDNVRTPVPAVVPDQSRRIDQAELTSLLKRGRELVAVGDIASARLLLRRAADAREPRAAFALAGTYDAAVLRRVKAYGIAPDIAMARTWYEKAREFGSSDAQRRLDQLQK